MLEISRGTDEYVVNKLLSDKNLFLVPTMDPWYGDILVYIHTQKFVSHLAHDAC